MFLFGGASKNNGEYGAPGTLIHPQPASNAIDFDEIVDSATLDADWIIGGSAYDIYSSAGFFIDNTASISGAINLGNLISCDTIDTDADGLLSCGTDGGGAGGGEVHGLLNTDWHTDVLLASVSQGSLIVGNSTPKWSELTIGASSSFLSTDGSDTFWLDDPTVASMSITNLWTSTLTGTLTGDLTCTNCLNATEIEDIYVLNTGDTILQTNSGAEVTPLTLTNDGAALDTAVTLAFNTGGTVGGKIVGFRSGTSDYHLQLYGYNGTSYSGIVIDGSGRVGIGDGLPAPYRLSVVGNSQFDGVVSISDGFEGVGLVDCDTANTSKLLWDATGKVFSCGTDYDTNTTYTATEPLSLVGTAFDIDYASAGGGGYLLVGDWQDWDDHVASTNAHLDWTLSGAGTIHTDNYIEGITYTAGDNLTLTGTDFDVDDPFTIVTFLTTHASISDELDVNGVASSTFAGDLDIEGDVNIGGNDLYVDASSGRVGIGMTTPAYTLDVYGDVRADYFTTNSLVDGYYIGPYDNYMASMYYQDDIFKFYSDSSNFYFNGNVGIGTTSPDSALDVVGQIIASSSFISGALTASGSVNFDGTASISSTLWVGGTITGNLTGAVTGNASTATALAANGANCEAGNYPLGVDVSGAVENCTADANTTYTGGDFLTLTGTDFDVDVAAVTNGDTTHLSSADAIYDFVIGLAYQTTAGMNTYAELNAIVADVTLTHNGLIDTFAELDAIVADKALVNKADGAVWLGVHDFGGATSFEIPNAANPTVNVAGQIAIDTTAGQLTWFNGQQYTTIATESFTFNISSASFDATNPTGGKKFNEPITITSINCITKSATSIKMQIVECDGNGANCVATDAATEITCSTTNSADDGALSNASIDAGDWVMASLSQASGEVDWVYITVEYFWTEQ